MLIHTHSDTCIRTLTHMTVSRHAYLHSSHTSWNEKKKKKNQASSCTTLEKKFNEQVLSCWVVIIIPIILSLTKSVLVLRERNWY